jgi:hypothetical protein
MGYLSLEIHLDGLFKRFVKERTTTTHDDS